tara:strand:+ start:170 stop:307 length:138 start_codon:yes stop_codon:yes gene_type:complete
MEEKSSEKKCVQCEAIGTSTNFGPSNENDDFCSSCGYDPYIQMMS